MLIFTNSFKRVLFKYIWVLVLTDGTYKHILKMTTVYVQRCDNVVHKLQFSCAKYYVYTTFIPRLTEIPKLPYCCCLVVKKTCSLAKTWRREIGNEEILKL